MDTSGTSGWSIGADLLLLALFGFVAVQLLRGRPRRAPVLVVVAVIVIGVPSLLQFAVPAVGRALERDTPMTLAHGEWWRPFTALLAQDGGPVAAVFNLIVVAFVVFVGERSWGRLRTAVAFLVPAIVLNLIALAWVSHGGGSSFAADGLMVGLTMWAALTRRLVPVRVIAVVQLAIGAGLVVLNDAHGLAMLVGAAIGLLIGAVDRSAGRIMDASPTRKDAS
jgi:hypothetical protein